MIMKTFTLSTLCLLTALSINAQVFSIDSPDSLAGNYVFGQTIDYGANLLDDVWCGDLMLADDGINPNNNGCTPLVNDLTGKIAVVDRGDCYFSLKSWHAQEAGAIAVVVINHIPGDDLFDMAGFDSSALVVIPTILVTYEDGLLIKDAMISSTVSACMGNIILDNNISISFQSVQVPLMGTIPVNQVSLANAYSSFVPATIVSNDGALDQTNIVTSAIINFSPFGGTTEEVYNESTTMDVLTPDTNDISVLPIYDFTYTSDGVYEITYTVTADTMDEFEFDNTIHTNFSISINAFCKSNWDFDNNRPIRNTALTVAGGGPIEIISGFHYPYDFGHGLDSVQFYCSTSNDNLDGITIKANVYEWDDLNNDSAYQNNELILVGLNSITFDDTINTEAWVTLPVLDAQTLDPGYNVPNAGRTYLVGTRYEGPDFVFFGFNDNYDHTLTNELATFPTFADFPYFQVTTFDGQLPDIENGGLFTDFFGSSTTVLFANETTISTKEILSESDASINLYPNPASDILTAEVELAEQSNNLTYKITDAQGRLVFSTSIQNVTADKTEFKVTQLPAGQYYMTIYTDKVIQTKTFTINR